MPQNGQKTSGSRTNARLTPIRMLTRVVPTPADLKSIEVLLEAPLPDNRREYDVDRALASNLEVLGGGLAAIGNFFVFHRLSFVKRRKASLLNRRNMNKNVLAAARGLNESKTLGRVEPLHSAFSHHVVSAGAKKQKRTAGPRKPACPTAARYALWGALDSANDRRIPAENDQYRGEFAVFWPFCGD